MNRNAEFGGFETERVLPEIYKKPETRLLGNFHEGVDQYVPSDLS